MIQYFYRTENLDFEVSHEVKAKRRHWIATDGKRFAVVATQEDTQRYALDPDGRADYDMSIRRQGFDPQLIEGTKPVSEEEFNRGATYVHNFVNNMCLRFHFEDETFRNFMIPA